LWRLCFWNYFIDISDRGDLHMSENYIPDEPIIPMLERAATFAREHRFSRGWYEPYEKAKAEIEKLQHDNKCLNEDLNDRNKEIEGILGEFAMGNDGDDGDVNTALCCLVDDHKKDKAEIKRLTDILTRNGFDAKTGKPPLGDWPPNFILKEEMEKLKVENSKLEYLKKEYARTIETLRVERNKLLKQVLLDEMIGELVLKNLEKSRR